MSVHAYTAMCSEMCGISSVLQLVLLCGDNIVVLGILAIAMFNFIQGIHGGNALYGTTEVVAFQTTICGS